MKEKEFLKITESKIIEYTLELKLPGLRKVFKEKYKEAANDIEVSHLDFLLELLECEYEQRVINRKHRRMRTANFPYKKYLEELELNYLPSDGRKKIKQLKTLEFILEGRNIILAGNPGTGKTHIAISLGIKACLEGFSVLFTTAPSLITDLKESRSERKLKLLESQFKKYDLVICDELGYISFDKEGAEMLFTHLSLRAGLKSTIVTTNLSFDRWSEIFCDPVLTAAMVDRLTHKSYMVNMTGSSYRIKET
ncbi:MAG: IS21-like element helper ATPase IstB, partial [Bacteroidales bacterium]|nr:IS21-like element helper ATPase IstB [Bacteroidales bacterium]